VSRIQLKADKKILQFARWAGVGFLFALNHSRVALYSSNETTKLFHGIASAGKGFLQSDWFYSTKDPLPAFSRFIAWSYSLFGEYVFYFYYSLLLAVYFYAVIKIFYPNTSESENNDRWLFATLVFIFYSRIVGEISQGLLGFDPTRILQGGVAEQNLIGPLFQNSLFGVFLVLSIPLFLEGRLILSALSIGMACTIHSAYLFGGAALTSAFMIIWVIQRKNIWKSFGFGVLTLILVLPTVITSGSTIASGGAESVRRALEIIVIERIPHHSLPSVWLDTVSIIKVIIIIVAICLNLRKPLGWILGIPFIAGLLGTLAQVITGNLELALIAPWRVSVFLVPLSVLSILHKILRILGKIDEQRSIVLVKLTCTSVIIFCTFSGIWIQTSRILASPNTSERRLMSYVEQTVSKDDLFMIPPRLFLLEQFRLRTGAPIIINWKSHPYGDEEVLEWYERNRSLSSFYEADSQSMAVSALREIRKKYHPTHVLIVNTAEMLNLTLKAIESTPVYVNDVYTLYQLH